MTQTQAMLALQTRSAPAGGPEAGWIARARDVALQEPLIESRPSEEALDLVRRRFPPRAVFVGVGICANGRVSRALPVDVLGMLLPAERLRRALRATSLVVMVADEHALASDLDAAQVRERTAETLRVLRRIRQRDLRHLRVVSASRFHGSAEYRRVLAQVSARAAVHEPAYFLREVADVAYLDRRLGGILKVGWTIGPSTTLDRKRDELAFDRRFRSWIGDHVPFVYCKAGRAYDEGQPKAAPYVTHDPARRICLRSDEDVAAKLRRWARASSPALFRGVRAHLKAIARAYSGLVEPLHGPVEARLQSIISRLFPEAERRA